jgi:hypothetical protein
LRLDLNLFYALWVQPVLDSYHGALLLLGRKSNFSSLPLMLKWISLTPTSICAPAVLRIGHPRMRGDSFIVSMSSTMKSTGTK